MSDEKTREFVHLLGANDRRLFAYVLSLVPNLSDAEDIAQQVRIALWEQFDKYDRTKNFGAWACTIAHYKILQYRDRSTKQKTVHSDEVLSMLAEQSVDHLQRIDEQYQALIQCLDELDSPKRELLMRYYSSNRPMRVVAQELGRTLDSVRNSILRIRKALGRCVRKKLQNSEPS